MEKYLENPVFICGHRKTGTTMLLNLLDNHDELLVYPPDSAFFYGYFPKYDNNEFSDEEKVSRLSEFIADQLEKEIKNLNEKDRESLNFSLDDFRNAIRKYATELDKSPKNMILSLMKAYREIFIGSQKAKMWVEKTTSTEIYALEIKEWFPKAKFIHVIRDPRDNWASLKSGWGKRYKNFNDSLNRLLQSMIDRGKLGMELAQKNQNILGKSSYKIVRFEDIVNNPVETLKDISEFLKIQYSEELLKPTVCGKLWKGNNFDGLKFDSPSNINAGRWSDRILPEEAMLLEYYFSDLMDEYGYKKSYSLENQIKAVIKHYKWFNFAQIFSQNNRSNEIK